MWMFIALAGAVGTLVYGWAILLDGKNRRREQEMEINAWCRANGEPIPYPEWEEYE